MTSEARPLDSRPAILLVDDEKVFRLLGRGALQPAGFEITEAESGEAALRVLEEGFEPALILLDLMMPGKDGFAVCSEIRSIPRLEHTPILIMTGLDDYESINHAYESGATDFITKPINWTLLSHRVRYLLRANEALARVSASERNLKGLIEAIPDTLLRINDNGEVLDFQPGKEFESREIATFESTDDHRTCRLPRRLSDGLRERFQHGRLEGSSTVFEYTEQHEPDQRCWEVRMAQTREREALVLVRDISDKRKAEREVKLLSMVVEQSPTSIIITDVEGNMTYVNSRLCELTGYQRDELIGQNPRVFAGGDLSERDYQDLWNTVLSGREWRGEFRTRRKDGQRFWERASICSIRDKRGQLSHLIAIKEDITDYKESEKYVKFLAYHDRLTGLPNRALFREQMQHAMAQALRTNESLVLMLLDIDDFKRINDTLGHTAGDLILKLIADKLQGNFRQSDILTHFTADDGNQIARIGGDEFAVCLSRVTKSQDAIFVARRILNIFSDPLRIDGQEIFVNAKIGISTYPQDGDDVDTLLRNAETAMYKIDRSSKKYFRFYSAEMNFSVSRKLHLESQLRMALNRNELKLAFQPQIETRTGRVVGAEVLMRWKSPNLGQVPPIEFVPIAEEYGLIDELGEWVMWSALEQARNWRNAGFPAIRLALNVSGRQLHNQRLLGIARKLLGRSGMDASQLEFELTETSIMQDLKAAHSCLTGIKDLGIRVALDDFGTGFSSLSYLRRLPLDLLKMDKSFVDNIGQSPRDAALAMAIINMGHSLRLEVLAEGVETQDQLKLLKQAHCNLIQGFVIARPKGSEEFAEWAFGNETDAVKDTVDDSSPIFRDR